MSDLPLVDALKQALDKDPRNGPLWLHYADLLAQAGRCEEAVAALRTAAALPAVKRPATLALVRLLRETGQLSEALIRTEAALEEEDDAELQAELQRIEAARAGAAVPEVPPHAPAPSGEDPASAPASSGNEEALASVHETPTDTEQWARQFDWGELHVTLDDVVGLDDVKRQIRLRIIAPFKQPHIYEAYGREGGGGLLLYGPPGCGKTYVARATAGELGARFVSVAIHEVVDKYWGESEKLVHALFEDARRNAPTVLFFDEFDALGSRRGGSGSQFWKTLVDQLLQEMDGVRGHNRDVLLFAATNAPWSVDPAFRRPGRFDRVLFVPTPDRAGRKALLERHARRLPGAQALDFTPIARATALWTGADLKALCERAAEGPLEASLNRGEVVPVRPSHFDTTLKQMTSTALEWIAQARNHARYANEGGHYDDLVRWLKHVRKW